MEDTKLQALHDTLAKLRGQKGLGTNSQYSWQLAATEVRHPAAESLPNNALYANFLPEGVYNPGSIQDGDGRSIKRDFSDTCTPSENDPSNESGGGRKRTKQEKKDAAKAAKLEAKRQVKLEEKKRLKKEASKLKRQKAEQSPGTVDNSEAMPHGAKAKKDSATKKMVKRGKKTAPGMSIVAKPERKDSTIK